MLFRFSALCEEVFHKYSDFDRIEKFSRPKVLRLLEILRLYRPPPFKTKHSVKVALSTDIGDAIPENEAVPEDDEQEAKTAEMQPVESEMIDAKLAEAIAEPVESDAAELVEEVAGVTDSVEPADTNVETAQASDHPAEGTTSYTRHRPPYHHHPHFSRRRRPDYAARHHRNRDDVHQLCGIIFAERRTTAKLLYHLLKDASRCDPQLAYLSPLYTVGKTSGMSLKEAESEERKQEDVMKRFRSRDCNVLVATSVLEDGIDVPACHLVVRYDLPSTYRAYVHSKARARARKAHYILLVEHEKLNGFLTDLSQFHAIEQILLRKSGYQQSRLATDVARFYHAEEALERLQPAYRPSESAKTTANLLNAIVIVNR